MDNKTCSKCGEKKEVSNFYTHPETSDGYLNKCKECAKKDAILNRKNKNTYYKNYDKGRYQNNTERLFRHKYYMMKQRVLGKNKKHKYTVVGKNLCSLNDFLSWCYSKNSMNQFIPIYQKWKDNKFVKKLSPSIDRINNNLGYEINNLQWLTQSNNSKKYNK